MIRIVTAEEDIPTPPQGGQPPPMPQLADDDPAEQTPAGEVAPPPGPEPTPLQPEPEAAPAATEEQIPEAGELPPMEREPFDPTKEYEEVVEPQTELDQLNQTLSIPEKIDLAIRERQPLRIIYTTLRGHTTERTIDPDYRHVAMTGHDILVAWCRLRNDWRGFITNRIRAAKLEEKGT